MNQIERILDANDAYAKARQNVRQAKPGRRLAVVTCMDSRIDVFAALGLHLGEAHVIRNAGGRMTDDVLRSLALSCHVLGVDTLVVMQHTKCGHAAALREDIEVLSTTPSLEPLKTIAGLVYDVETGELEDLVRWERSPTEPGIG